MVASRRRDPFWLGPAHGVGTSVLFNTFYEPEIGVERICERGEKFEPDTDSIAVQSVEADELLTATGTQEDTDGIGTSWDVPAPTRVAVQRRLMASFSAGH
jgi:hypothetical protein